MANDYNNAQSKAETKAATDAAATKELTAESLDPKGNRQKKSSGKVDKKSNEEAILDFLISSGPRAGDAVRALAQMALADKKYDSLSEDDCNDIHRYLNYGFINPTSGYTSKEMLLAHRKERSMLLRRMVKPLVDGEDRYELVIDAVMNFALDMTAAQKAAEYLNKRKQDATKPNQATTPAQ